ncbi:MAG: FAD-binding protein, partial [Verrucomicrobiaceae bacterium]
MFVSRRKFLGLSMVMAPAWSQGQVKPALRYLQPGDAGYEDARKPFNSTILLKPSRIACCRTEADVIAAVRHAEEAGLPIAVKSGGHDFHGFSLNEGGLLIELSGMADRELDPKTNHFTSGPGLKLKDCYSKLLPNG